MIADMLDWITTIPGILVSLGVVLLIVAVIMFIIGSSKEKKEKKEHIYVDNTEVIPVVNSGLENNNMEQNMNVINNNFESATNNLENNQVGVMPTNNFNNNYTNNNDYTNYNTNATVQNNINSMNNIPVNPINEPVVNLFTDVAPINPVITPVQEVVEPVVVDNEPVNPMFDMGNVADINPVNIEVQPVNQVVEPIDVVPNTLINNSVAPINVPTEFMNNNVVEVNAPEEIMTENIDTNGGFNNNINSTNNFYGEPRPIYGGANPLDATQNLPKIDVHHVPYSGGMIDQPTTTNNYPQPSNVVQIPDDIESL